jgi:septal ring factor EnvC (AmiA/AmiB activator)
MPSVLGLMERREARARQDLESWTEVLEEAQAEVDAARERVERARVGREELVSVLAEESTVNTRVPCRPVVRRLPLWDRAAPARGMASAAGVAVGHGRGDAQRPVPGDVRRCGGRFGAGERGGVDAGGGPGRGDQERGGEDPSPCLRAGEAGLAGAGQGRTVHART